MDRYHQDRTNPAQPLTRLFAISDLRQLKGHRKQDVDEGVSRALARIGIGGAAGAGGWGVVLDGVYDGAIEELTIVNDVLGQALALIAKG